MRHRGTLVVRSRGRTYLAREVELNGLDADVLGTGCHVEAYKVTCEGIKSIE